MPRISSSSKKNTGLADATFVLDNGGYTMKAGFAPSAGGTPTYDDCAVIPNCIAYSSRDRCSYVGSQLEKCVDFAELAFRRPVQKGFVVNWESERVVWNNEFFDDDARTRVCIYPYMSLYILMTISAPWAWVDWGNL